MQVLFDTGDIAPYWPDKALSASNIDRNSLVLTWSSATDDVCAATYRIYQDDQIIGEVAGYSTMFNVTGLEEGTSYCFKIEAGDGAKNWSSDGPDLEVTTLPKLTADSENNYLGCPITITFSDNIVWRTAISEITVDGATIEASSYNVEEGKVIISTKVFTEIKDYEIVVKAPGYVNAGVTQTIEHRGIYTINLVEDAAYTTGETNAGIKTMEVNSGTSGLQYFTVNVVPVKEGVNIL